MFIPSRSYRIMQIVRNILASSMYYVILLLNLLEAMRVGMQLFSAWCAKKLTTFCNLRGICYYNSKNDWLHATHSKTWFKISLKNLFEPNDSWNNWNNIWTNWIYLNQHLNTFLNWLNQYLIWLNLFESYKVRLREDICKLSVQWKTFFLN